MNARVRTSLQSMKTPSKNVKVSFLLKFFSRKFLGSDLFLFFLLEIPQKIASCPMKRYVCAF